MFRRVFLTGVVLGVTAVTAGFGTAAEPVVLKGHGKFVNAVAFSPDGKIVASAGWDCTVRLWDARTGAIVKVIRTGAPKTNAVAFSPDGKTLAFGGNRKSLKLWDVLTGKVKAEHEAGANWITAAAFSPDGSRLAFADGVSVWAGPVGGKVEWLGHHTRTIFSIAFAPDGKTLAAAGDSGAVVLYDLAEKKVKTRVIHRRDVAWSVAFSPDGRRLVVGEHWHLYWYDLQNLSAKPVMHENVHLLKGTQTVAFNRDGTMLASGGGATIVLWGPEGQHLRTIYADQGGVTSVAFSPDGQTLASAGEDGTVKLWRVREKVSKT